MRVIVAGSRTVTDYSQVKSIIEATMQNQGFGITEIVSGMAKGVDLLAVRWANEVGLPFKPFPADWQNLDEPCVIKRRKDGSVYNALAGFNRNLKMALYADILIAIWDGVSNGTEHMINTAKENGLIIYLKQVVSTPPDIPPITYEGL